MRPQVEMCGGCRFFGHIDPADPRMPTLGLCHRHPPLPESSRPEVETTDNGCGEHRPRHTEAE